SICAWKKVKNSYRICHVLRAHSAWTLNGSRRKMNAGFLSLYIRMPDQTLDPLLDVTTASGLLPAGTALSTFADNKRSCFGNPISGSGIKLALGLKTTVAHVIHYCQLGKLNIDCK